jgi:hypothetical protein
MLARSRRRTPCAWALFVLGACSSLPEAGYPPFAEHTVVADFVVGDAGLLPVPSSHSALVVHELGTAPAATAERFGPRGERFLVFAPGTAVRVRCRFRAYADGNGQLPSPADVLPGARRVQIEDSP